MQPELPLADQRLATGAGSIYDGSNPSLSAMESGAPEILRARFEAARIHGWVWAVPGCCKQNHLPKTDLSGPKRRESMARYGRFPTAVSKIICQKPTRKAHQVELWFARIEREVVARGVFTSVNDLARKLMRYIRHHNQHAAPIKWAYRDFSHRITATFDSAVTGH
jgi:hypothetical protein